MTIRATAMDLQSLVPSVRRAPSKFLSVENHLSDFPKHTAGQRVSPSVSLDLTRVPTWDDAFVRFLTIGDKLDKQSAPMRRIQGNRLTIVQYSEINNSICQLA